MYSGTAKHPEDGIRSGAGIDWVERARGDARARSADLPVRRGGVDCGGVPPGRSAADVRPLNRVRPRSSPGPAGPPAGRPRRSRTSASNSPSITWSVSARIWPSNMAARSRRIASGSAIASTRYGTQARPIFLSVAPATVRTRISSSASIGIRYGTAGSASGPIRPMARHRFHADTGRRVVECGHQVGQRRQGRPAQFAERPERPGGGPGRTRPGSRRSGRGLRPAAAAPSSPRPITAIARTSSSGALRACVRIGRSRRGIRPARSR